MEKEVIRVLRSRYADLLHLPPRKRKVVMRKAFVSLYLDGAPIVDSKFIQGKKVLKIK